MIPRKKKVCKSCGEERYIVSHGLCSYCYQVERAQEAHKAPLARHRSTISSQGYKNTTKSKKVAHRKAMAHRKKKETVTDKFLKEHWGFRSQVELFDYIWLSRPKKCPISGLDLKPFEYSRHEKAMCCAHLLPKGTHPLFKLNPDNILLVHPTVHSLFDQGTEKAREAHPEWDWTLLFYLQARMKRKYKKFKEDYLL